ncbi:MAG: phytanoyl-CoA dioxygenase family protein [Fimbriimonadaceae bacterium]|nr:phytanoyl-CoA dioxygenase family protein [Fimbriimonadaceae bacterium]
MLEQALVQTKVKDFEQNGFTLVPQLFSEDEVEALRDHFMDLRQESRPLDDRPPEPNHQDPLRRYPRLMQPHRYDQVAFDWLIDQRLDQILTQLTGSSPYAVQTMVYFKPPGARGQALHQDNFYLRAHPGTCIAAWLALDDCSEENGCMMLMKGSQDLPILCTVEADSSQSFTDVTVPVPDDAEIVPARMKAGDVLFFNGSVIHGSLPNTSQDLFRRALIGHYVTGDCSHVAKGYFPAFRMDGTQISLEPGEAGDTCGVWVDGTDGSEVTLVPARDHDKVLRTE